MELSQIIRRYETRYQNALTALCGKEKYDPNTIIWVCAVLKRYKTKRGAAAYIKKSMSALSPSLQRRKRFLRQSLKTSRKRRKHEPEDKAIRHLKRYKVVLKRVRDIQNIKARRDCVGIRIKKRILK